METVLIVLIIIALAATFIVLGVGLLSMLRGGEFNRKYGNLLMRARVGTQVTTVVLLIVWFLTFHKG